MDRAGGAELVGEKPRLYGALGFRSSESAAKAQVEAEGGSQRR